MFYWFICRVHIVMSILVIVIGLKDRGAKLPSRLSLDASQGLLSDIIQIV